MTDDTLPDATQAGKHTLGPWEKCHDHPDPETARSLAHIRGPRGECGFREEVATVYGCNGVYDGDMTPDANARLIAAAPDMLEALMEVVDTCRADCPAGLPALKLARAAIAKATGDAQ